MPLSDSLTIETPEQIPLEYPLAGIGSRFLALAYDTCLQVIGFFILLLGRSLTIGFAGIVSSTWMQALLVLAGFCIYYGYFAFFEAIWNGQTPGKRNVHIRVIKESGRPISSYEAITRNLLRIVDQLPGLYVIAIVVAVLNRNHKRLGDYVAGTVVIHEKPLEGSRPMWTIPEKSAAPTYDVRQLSLQELELIETFLQRRSTLEDTVRRSMARQIAQRVAEKLGIPREERPSAELATIGPSGILGLPRDHCPGAEDFLETLARERRSAWHR